MELCTRTFTSFLLPSSFLSSNKILLLANANSSVFKFNSLKLFAPHDHLFQPFISRYNSFSSPFTVSAASSSSSVAVGTEQDRLPAELKVTETEQLKSTVKLHVEVPPLVCEDCYKRVIAEFMKQAKVPGFRPGKKVPEEILIGYVGRQNVQKATIESILRRTLSHAMTSVGDIAVLDISATTIDQDESNVKTIPSAESKGFNFDTEDGDKVLPGFLDSIIGIQRGESKSFPLVFPETWNQENLRGVHAQFNVECKELFYRDLPELDDSIADKLLPGCSTVEQVKDLLLQRCLEVEQTAREQATDNAILDQISKMVEVDIPQSLFEEQGRQLYGANLLEIQAKMKLSEQQLASLSSPKAVNQYLEHQKENITNLIKQNLAVGDIYRRENLQFATEDLVKEVENSIAEFKRQNQEYDEERVKDQVQEILEGAKVLEWLREHAEIQYITR
ncbi:trigger factor-like protein TIG, Chloroplastic isoform X2 [Vigna umbellata]|uniref:trigger factor-like protein TIG, Chloroplastic isoform X2 n=1 Tax=Vigna umbellata TaxID=87088 RepID=UPI001F5F0E64|nr:trigger factor-like protein TIG, Chloroplastic isoform X2 [Vigna umbellata]